AGQIDMNFTGPNTSVPQVRAGTIKAYAVMATSRLAIAPEIPTVDEAGLPGLYFSLWHDLWGPKGTPKGVIAKINEAVAMALADPTIRQKLADQAMDIPRREEQTSEALGAYQKAEIEKWWPIIKAANIKGE
ncbi:MAG TPA: tripartite tricarboxylate transporter substrate-binding protein, partial [Aestuariivirgaceae bacterium]|nr:tripartite tricarboxylate transporter substrate-binding protein [Aestuariivirgaceae bacterium]